MRRRYVTAVSLIFPGPADPSALTGWSDEASIGTSLQIPSSSRRREIASSDLEDFKVGLSRLEFAFSNLTDRCQVGRRTSHD